MIRVRTKIATRWKQQIREANTPLTVLSPYITSNSTLELLAEKKATFYTRFDVRDFVSKASSLAAIKLLLKSDCKVFEVEGLHAKVVMDQATFVTIGSQNLTFRGASKNKEISACFDNGNPKACARVREVVKAWATDPNVVAIDWSRYERMKADVRAAKKAFQEYDDALAKIQSKTDKHQAAKVKKARAQETQNAVKRSRDNWAALDEAIKSGIPSSTRYIGTVKPGKKSPRILFNAQADLLQWTSRRGKPYPPLKRSSRCFCLLDKHKVGWARLASTQITKFALKMKVGQVLPPPFSEVDVTLSTEPKDLERGSQESTLVAILSASNGKELCLVSILYSIDDISVLGTSVRLRTPTGKKPKKTDRLKADVRDWIDANEGLFEKVISQNITSTTPLKKRLEGVNADAYFGGMDRTVEITMVFKGPGGKKPIMVATTRGEPPFP